MTNEEKAVSLMFDQCEHTRPVGVSGSCIDCFTAKFAQALEASRAAGRAERDGEVEKGRAFKQYVHDRLDQASVPANPQPPHHALAGCRIGDRLDFVFGKLEAAEAKCAELETQVKQAQANARTWEANANEWKRDYAQLGEAAEHNYSSLESLNESLRIQVVQARREGIEAACRYLEEDHAWGDIESSSAAAQIRANLLPSEPSSGEPTK